MIFFKVFLTSLIPTNNTWVKWWSIILNKALATSIRNETICIQMQKLRNFLFSNKRLVFFLQNPDFVHHLLEVFLKAHRKCALYFHSVFPRNFWSSWRLLWQMNYFTPIIHLTFRPSGIVKKLRNEGRISELPASDFWLNMKRLNTFSFLTCVSENHHGVIFYCFSPSRSQDALD